MVKIPYGKIKFKHPSEIIHRDLLDFLIKHDINCFVISGDCFIDGCNENINIHLIDEVDFNKLKCLKNALQFENICIIKFKKFNSSVIFNLDCDKSIFQIVNSYPFAHQMIGYLIEIENKKLKIIVDYVHEKFIKFIKDGIIVFNNNVSNIGMESMLYLLTFLETYQFNKFSLDNMLVFLDIIEHINYSNGTNEKIHPIIALHFNIKVKEPCTLIGDKLIILMNIISSYLYGNKINYSEISSEYNI
jgi:hypothetical protein